MIQKYQNNRLGYSCRFFTFSSNTNQPSILQGIKTSEKPKILPVIIGNLLPSLKHNFLSHILLFYSACSVYECTASREEWRALIQPILLPSPPKPTLCPCASDDNAGFEWLWRCCALFRNLPSLPGMDCIVQVHRRHLKPQLAGCKGPVWVFLDQNKFHWLMDRWSETMPATIRTAAKHMSENPSPLTT
jgi:hypothetical protein